MDELLTVEEVAGYYKVKRTTIYRWIKSGRLNPIDIGGGDRPTWRIPASSLQTGGTSAPRPESKRRHF